MEAYVQNLHSLLEQTVAPDTQIIKNATATLNAQYYKSPECIPGLFEVVASSPMDPVRQLAAVELRKRVGNSNGNLWKNCPQDIRTSIKSRLLEVILVENSNLVRHSCARVISAIAEIELPLNTWPDLLGYLTQASTSANAAHREIGIFVLYALLETIIEGFESHLPSLFALFAKSITDPESLEVRVTTLKALGKVAEYIDIDDKNDIKTFQGLIEPMVVVLQQALEAGHEDSVKAGFDVFETMLIIEAPLLSKAIPDLVQFFLTSASNSNYDDSLRVMCLNCLLWTVKYKKSKIQSLGLAKPILERLLPIGAEEDPDDIDEDSPSRLSFRVLDTLATSLPPSQVFPPLYQQLREYMTSPQAPLRKSAMMAFGVTVEGCSEFIRPHIDELWPFIDAGLQDAEPIVRKAACVALGCVCDMLGDEAAERHGVLLPLVFNLMNDEATQRPACTALDALLEVLGDDINQYLPMLMERLVGLLSTAPLAVKSTVTGAIGSAAHAAKAQFVPYFTQTIQLIRPFLGLTEEGEEMDLRGVTMDAVGTIAEAVGAEVFRPVFQDIMQQAYAGMNIDSPRLRECSFIFFTVMTRVFGEEFSPFLGDVVPALLRSLSQDETDDLEGGGDGLFDAGEENIEDIDPEKMLSVNSAMAIEKEVAADAIGEIFINTKSNFLPFVEESVGKLVEQLEHYYEGIRKSAISSLFAFMSAFYDISSPAPWQAGIATPYHENVEKLIEMVLPAIFDAWAQEDDKQVVTTIVQELAETLNKMGPSFILREGRVESVCNSTAEILNGKSLCQQDPDQDDEIEDDVENAEYESVLIQAAGDLVGALATSIGQQFSQPFGTFLPLIAKFYGKGRAVGERSSVIGTIGEIIVGLKSGITPHTENVLKLILTALTDDEAEVRSNAAFATGVLVENSEIDLSGQYMMILSALKPLFDVGNESPGAVLNARDNAAGAVSRMIIKNGAAMPLDQVLSVLIGVLPLKNDLLENGPVFRAIFTLFRSNANLIMPELPKLLAVFSYVLDPSLPEQVGQDIKAELVELIKAINQQTPDQVAQAGLNAYL
ncbi:ARM repeat-containing protein [Wallemia mellicola]|uniref:ARM repeat-containing protein n=1 Tax=Wallemia mellicola TaxID=1708541 RepID=A0A4T0NJM5_9BASI|nr:ARM repeat-containing protein [Wallemia mellicola]